MTPNIYCEYSSMWKTLFEVFFIYYIYLHEKILWEEYFICISNMKK